MHGGASEADPCNCLFHLEVNDPPRLLPFVPDELGVVGRVEERVGVVRVRRGHTSGHCCEKSGAQQHGEVGSRPVVLPRPNTRKGETPLESLHLFTILSGHRSAKREASNIRQRMGVALPSLVILRDYTYATTYMTTN
jgi:hypothetical protein